MDDTVATRAAVPSLGGATKQYREAYGGTSRPLKFDMHARHCQAYAHGGIQMLAALSAAP